MTPADRVWCGWCKYYVAREAFEKIHIPRHSKSMADAAGYRGDDNRTTSLIVTDDDDHAR